MGDVKHVRTGELTSSEVLSALDAGTRVVIEVGIAGVTLDMAIRKRGGTYYCDTPMKLLTYEDEEGMRTCLERYRLAAAEPEE